MARGKIDVKIRLERQEKKILELTDALETAKELYQELLMEQQEEDKKRLYEAFQKSRRSVDEVIEFMKGKADL